MTKEQVKNYCFKNGYEARYSGHSKSFTVSPILPTITKESLLFHLNSNGIEEVRIEKSKFNFINPKANKHE
jgi:hypothetical protein